jgi:hypothetical protein
MGEQRAAQFVLEMPGQLISFQTSDGPEAVFSFYKEQLTRMHWSHPSYEDDRLLTMENRQACPIYNLQVTATVTNSVTDVVADVSPSRCEDR